MEKVGCLAIVLAILYGIAKFIAKLNGIDLP